MIKTIHVTEEHIANGVPEDCFRCAVALAFNEALGGKWEVGIAYAWNNDVVVSQQPMIALPADAQRLIIQFDTTGTASPMSFLVDVPQA